MNGGEWVGLVSLGVAVVGALVTWMVLRSRQMAAVAAALSQTKIDAASAQERVRALEERNAALFGENGPIRRDLEVIRNQRDAARTAVAGLREPAARVAGLEEDLRTARETLGELERARAALDTRLQALPRLEERLADAEAALRTANQRITDSTARIATLDTTLSQERRGLGAKLALLKDAEARMGEGA